MTWQTVALGCLLWVAGTMVAQTGVYLVDKTTKLNIGAGLILLGSLLQFVAFLVLWAPK